MIPSNDNLTPGLGAAILSAPSPHVTVRVSSREKQEMPIKARLIHRLRYHMQKIIYGGRYLGSFGSRGSLAMSTNPHNVHRPKFSSFKRCPLTFTREHIMSHSKSTQSVQNQDNNTQRAPLNDFVVSYYFIAVDQQRKDHKLLSVPVSPNFKTKIEAKAFLDNCPVQGAYLLYAEFFADDAAQAESLALDIFGEVAEQQIIQA